MKNSCFVKFSILFFSIVLLAASCEGNGKPNPYVGVMPSINLQQYQAKERLVKNTKTKNARYMRKYDRIIDRFEKKRFAEVERLAGTSMPCKSLDDNFHVVNNTAICEGGSSILKYHAKVYFKESVHVIDHLSLIIKYVDSEGNVIKNAGMLAMNPKSSGMSGSGYFDSGTVYDLYFSFANFAITGYSDDPKLFQQKFSGVTLEPDY